MKQVKQQRGISAIFVLVMLLFMMIIGLTFLMVANLGRKNANSVGRKHAFESGESATDRIVNRLRYDMLGNNAVMGDVYYTLRNPSGKGNIEYLNERKIEYQAATYVNLPDRGKQYPEIMTPADDEPYDYPYTNGDRQDEMANIAGMGMEDDPWLASSRPTPVNANGIPVSDPSTAAYWRWDHISDLREVSLNPRNRIFLGYYQRSYTDPNNNNNYYDDKVETGEDVNGVKLYEILPETHNRDDRVWKQADGSHQYYLIDSGNTLDEFNPDRAPFLVNVRANSTVSTRQSRDFSEHEIPDASLDGWYDLSTGVKKAAQDGEDGIPDFEAFMPDADGDGIPDSRWMWAPLPQIRDVRYVMAVRVVDLSSKVNINHSVAARGSLAPYNYSSSTPNYTYTHIDSSLLIHRLNGTLYSSPSPTAIHSSILTQKGNYDTLDELFLRHGGTITSFRDPTTLVKNTGGPFSVRSDEILKDAYDSMYITTGDPTYPAFSGATWNQKISMMMDVTRNPKDVLTTMSGAIDLAPSITLKDTTQNLAVVQGGGSEIVDNVRLRKNLNDVLTGGTDYEKVRRLQYEFKQVWNHAEDGMKTPYWVQKTLADEDNIDAWTMRMALAVKDYYDNDNTVSVVDASYGAVNVAASGMEKLPFVSEVVIVKPYTHNEDGATPAFVFEPGAVGLVVEVRNPFSTTLSNLNNATLKIGNAVLPLSTAHAGSLGPNESLVIFININVPDTDTGLTPNKALFVNDGNVATDVFETIENATYKFDWAAGMADVSSYIEDDGSEKFVLMRTTAKELSTNTDKTINYQGVKLTNSDASRQFPSTVNAAIPAGHVSDHRYYKRFHYIGNHRGWKMIMLRHFDASSSAKTPRYRFESNDSTDATPKVFGDPAGRVYAGVNQLKGTYDSSTKNENIFPDPNSTKPMDYDLSPTTEKPLTDQIVISNHGSATPIRRMNELLYINLLTPGGQDNAGAWVDYTINDIVTDYGNYWSSEVATPDDFRFDIDGSEYTKQSNSLVKDFKGYVKTRNTDGNSDMNEIPMRTIQSKWRVNASNAATDSASERAMNLQGDQLSYLQVPPIHMFLSRFSNATPYKDLIEYTYTDSDSDGLYDDATVAQDAGQDPVEDNLVRHGAININTVDKQTLMHVLPGIYGFDDDVNEKIADAIIKYRDNPRVDTNGDGTPDTHFRVAPVTNDLSTTGLGLPTTWRGGRDTITVYDPNVPTKVLYDIPALPGGRPGIAHMSELAVVFKRLREALGVAHALPFNNGLDKYDVSKIGAANDFFGGVTGGSDGIVDDFVERYAMYGFMSEMFVTRSDYYAVYVLLRGYTFDPSSGFEKLGDLVEQKRYVYIIDRASLMSGNKNVSIRANLME